MRFAARFCPLSPGGRGLGRGGAWNDVDALKHTVHPEPVEGSSAKRDLVFATFALHGRARPVTFGIAPKVTKNASPCTPLHPPVLATGGMRRTAHESFAIATHSVCRRRIYDRPLLRSSARAEGAFEPMFDRFAMTTTRSQRSPLHQFLDCRSQCVRDAFQIENSYVTVTTLHLTNVASIQLCC